MRVLSLITAPTGETKRFLFPSRRVALNAGAALLEHGFDLSGRRHWLSKYGRFLIDAR